MNRKVIQALFTRSSAAAKRTAMPRFTWHVF